MNKVACATNFGHDFKVQKKTPSHMWWKEPKQYIQWDFVEHIV